MDHCLLGPMATVEQSQTTTNKDHRIVPSMYVACIHFYAIGSFGSEAHWAHGPGPRHLTVGLHSDRKHALGKLTMCPHCHVHPLGDTTHFRTELKMAGHLLGIPLFRGHGHSINLQPRECARLSRYDHTRCGAYLCMHIRVYIYICVYIHTLLAKTKPLPPYVFIVNAFHVCMYVSMYTCMYVCVYVCM
jgi:hypothetical protein